MTSTSASSPQLTWTGPAPISCDLCKRNLLATFYDFRVKGGGWAIGCPSCFKEYGSGLGVGKGQEYDKNTLTKLRG